MSNTKKSFAVLFVIFAFAIAAFFIATILHNHALECPHIQLSFGKPKGDK